MQINHVTNYAIKSMVYLATIGHSVSSQEIAEATAVSRNLLMNILCKLRENHLITAERGVRGGYSLARPASELSLLDIIRCMERTVYINHCLEPDTTSHIKNDPNFEHIQQYFERLQAGLENSLSNMTLDKLIHPDSVWHYPATSV